MIEPRRTAELPGWMVPRTIMVDFWIMSVRLSRCNVEAGARQATVAARMINLRITVSYSISKSSASSDH